MITSTTEKTWNAVALIALVCLAALAVFDLVVPKPVAPSKHAQTVQKQLLMRTIEIHQQDANAARTEVARYIWQAKKTDEIGAKSLSAITALATKHKVSLLGFRPQKASVQDSLTQLPYLIILEGDFPGVTAFLNDLENIQTKLAINMVQVSSSEANSDRVNANIGVIAYTMPPENSK